MNNSNKNPEQLARDQIDALLTEASWVVQNKKAIDFNAGQGIAVREYQTDAGPADYALFVDKKAVGVIEAKPSEWGHKLTTVEEQSGGYAGPVTPCPSRPDLFEWRSGPPRARPAARLRGFLDRLAGLTRHKPKRAAQGNRQSKQVSRWRSYWPSGR